MTARKLPTPTIPPSSFSVGPKRALAGSRPPLVRTSSTTSPRSTPARQARQAMWLPESLAPGAPAIGRRSGATTAVCAGLAVSRRRLARDIVDEYRQRAGDARLGGG